ncbi:hypothetical protein NQ344_26820, partial [Escherichia coli]|nr:hypothetical protein [Escherichia coli]
IENKRWLFYPGETEAKAQLTALRNQRDAAAYAALDEVYREERRLDVALNAARADAIADRLMKIEKNNARFRSATPAEKLAFLTAKLGT